MSEPDVESVPAKTETSIIPKKFKTEKGSIYTYDSEGRVSRHKTLEDKHFPTQNLTVFVDITDEEIQNILDDINSEGERTPCITQKDEDGSYKIIHDLDVVDRDKPLYLARAYPKKRQLSIITEADLLPREGMTVFEIKTSKDNDGNINQLPHLGHKVTEIVY